MEATLAVPELSAEDLRALLRRLRESATPPDRRERCRMIAAAAASFLDPGEERRGLAEELLPRITGFSPAMIREGLIRTFAALDAASLEKLTREVVAVAPLVGIVSAGNVPGVALPKAALALAAGAACFVKSASREPLLTALFAEALTAVDAKLGRRIGVGWWRGGSRALDAVLAGESDSLVAYGSDEAIAALRALAPAAFVAHGHRVSIGIVRLDRASAIDRMACAAALDVALYDQLGCLSPQCVYAIGTDADRETFVGSLASALDRLRVALPRGVIPEAAAIAIRRLRDDLEWREIAGEPVRLRSSREGTEWTVLGERRAEFLPSPLYRTVFVLPLREAADLGRVLGGAADRIECAGIAPFPDEELGRALTACGVPNVVPLGDMQRPALEWRQGGKHPLAGIVREDE